METSGKELKVLDQITLEHKQKFVKTLRKGQFPSSKVKNTEPSIGTKISKKVEVKKVIWSSTTFSNGKFSLKKECVLLSNQKRVDIAITKQ